MTLLAGKHLYETIVVEKRKAGFPMHMGWGFFLLFAGIIGLIALFGTAFWSTGSREALDPEVLQKRLLLCMYGMGTNMGLKRMAGVDPQSCRKVLEARGKKEYNKNREKMLIDKDDAHSLASQGCLVL